MGYIVGHPIKHPRDFYGRSQEVYRFYEIVAGTQAQSVSLLGLRRAGKTSFLKYVAHPDVMRHHLSDPERYTMLYLDVSTCRTPADFYSRILRQLQRTVGELPQTNLWKPSPAGSATLYDLESALCHFPERRFVLLLDEFDQLKSGSFDVDFLSELRSLTSVWEYELACVTASYWDLYQLGAHIGLPPTSPFYNIFYPTPIYLNGLQPQDASLLVRMPVQHEAGAFSDAEATQLLTLSGTLPFFVQATAATFWRQKRENLSLHSEQLQHQLVVELSSYFMQWWRQLSSLEHDLLRTVAKGEPLHQLPYSRLEVRESARRLLNYGILQEKTSERFAINGDLFATWLRHYAGRVMFASGAANGSRRRKTRQNGEPFLAMPAYENILQTIHDVGKQFERLPATYSQKGEEELRDHMLLVLEPRFEGAATGESFNKTGKTDIMIRERGSNIFIAECKFWKGARVYLETIDQLLGYLTWRDSKAAVVVFVRNKEFSSVIQTVQQVTPNHSNYLEYVGMRDESWLDYHFHINGDPDRIVKLAVMLFHVPR